MKTFLALLVVAAIAGMLAYLGMSANGGGMPVPEVKIVTITTPTTLAASGPTILQAIRNHARLETISMSIAGDQDISRVWGLEGVCRESLTYLGYFTVTAGIDLQELANADILVEGSGSPAQTALTLRLPPASILHVELETQRSRVVSSSPSILSQVCGSQLAGMVLDAQKSLRSSAETSARRLGILEQAQDRAAFEMKKLLLQLGYANVTIQFKESVDER